MALWRVVCMSKRQQNMTNIQPTFQQILLNDKDQQLLPGSCGPWLNAALTIYEFLVSVEYHTAQSVAHVYTCLTPDRQIALTSKLKNHGLGQYGAEPHYSTLPFWQLCALKG